MHQSRGDLSPDGIEEYRVSGGASGDGGTLRDQAAAMGQLLVAEYRALMTYARRLTANGPDARDLVQMLCARVLSQGAAMVKPDNASAWLRTALFRLYVDFRRRSLREVRTHIEAADWPELQAEPEVPSGPVPMLTMVTIDDVRSLLIALPAHYRVPYELFSFEGMSYEQISSRLGLPSRTVGTRINRARKRLRGLLQTRYR